MKGYFCEKLKNIKNKQILIEIENMKKFSQYNVVIEDNRIPVLYDTGEKLSQGLDEHITFTTQQKASFEKIKSNRQGLQNPNQDYYLNVQRLLALVNYFAQKNLLSNLSYSQLIEWNNDFHQLAILEMQNQGHNNFTINDNQVKFLETRNNKSYYLVSIPYDEKIYNEAGKVLFDTYKDLSKIYKEKIDDIMDIGRIQNGFMFALNTNEISPQYIATLSNNLKNVGLDSSEITFEKTEEEVEEFSNNKELVVRLENNDLIIGFSDKEIYKYYFEKIKEYIYKNNGLKFSRTREIEIKLEYYAQRSLTGSIERDLDELMVFLKLIINLSKENKIDSTEVEKITLDVINKRIKLISDKLQNEQSSFSGGEDPFIWNNISSTSEDGFLVQVVANPNSNQFQRDDLSANIKYIFINFGDPHPDFYKEYTGSGRFGYELKGDYDQFIQLASSLEYMKYDASNLKKLIAELVNSGIMKSELKPFKQYDGFEKRKEDGSLDLDENGFIQYDKEEFRKNLDFYSNKLGEGRELYDKQKDGIEALYSSKSFILGDEVGVGKTVQCVSAADMRLKEADKKLEAEGKKARGLIITVNGVVPQYISEIKRFTDYMEVGEVGEEDKAHYETARMDVSTDPNANTRWTVVSYSSFHNTHIKTEEEHRNSYIKFIHAIRQLEKLGEKEKAKEFKEYLLKEMEINYTYNIVNHEKGASNVERIILSDIIFKLENTVEEEEGGEVNIIDHTDDIKSIIPNIDETQEKEIDKAFNKVEQSKDNIIDFKIKVLEIFRKNSRSHVTLKRNLEENVKDKFKTLTNPKKEINMNTFNAMYGRVSVNSKKTCDVFVEDIERSGYTVCIFDELHNAKTLDGLTNNNIIKATKDIPYKWGATSTVISNKPIDGLGQLKVIGHPVGKMNENQYIANYVGPNITTSEGAGSEEDQWERITKAMDLMKMLNRTGTYMRRSKEQVRPDMKELKIIKNIAREIPEVAHDLASSYRDDYENKELPIVIMTSNRRAYANIKAPKTANDVISSLMEGENQIIVFTSFNDAGFAIKESIEEYVEIQKEDFGNRDITCDFYYSGVEKKQREEMINDFKIGNLNVLILSTKAGGTGLDLPNTAKRVFVNDFGWSPGEAEQLEGRAYRISNEQDVETFYTVLKDHKDTESILDSLYFEYVTAKREIANTIKNQREELLDISSNPSSKESIERENEIKEKIRKQMKMQDELDERMREAKLRFNLINGLPSDNHEEYEGYYLELDNADLQTRMLGLPDRDQKIHTYNLCKEFGATSDEVKQWLFKPDQERLEDPKYISYKGQVFLKTYNVGDKHALKEYVGLSPDEKNKLVMMPRTFADKYFLTKTPQKKKIMLATNNMKIRRQAITLYESLSKRLRGNRLLDTEGKSNMMSLFANYFIELDDSGRNSLSRLKPSILEKVLKLPKNIRTKYLESSSDQKKQILEDHEDLADELKRDLEKEIIKARNVFSEDWVPDESDKKPIQKEVKKIDKPKPKIDLPSLDTKAKPKSKIDLPSLDTKAKPKPKIDKPKIDLPDLGLGSKKEPKKVNKQKPSIDLSNLGFGV